MSYISRPLRILHVIESTATGTLTMLSEQVQIMESLGAEVTVLYSRRSETPESLNSFFSSKTNLIFLPMDTFTHQVKAVGLIRKIFNERQFSYVFLHSSIAGFLGRLALLGTSVKTYYFPHCISFLKTDITYIERSFFWLLELFATLKMSTYIPCSLSELKIIKLYLPHVKTKLILNAVEFVDVVSDIKFEDRENIVIMVGQIRKQKNPLLFAKIAADLRKRGLGIKLLWIGDGDTDYKGELIKQGVEVLGWMQRKHVYEKLNTAKVFLSTSDWEGLPVSVLEAMNSGCVVVLSNKPGHTDLVESGVNGFLFKDDIQAADLIESICNQSLDIHPLVLESKKLVQTQYQLSRYRDDIKDLLS